MAHAVAYAGSIPAAQRPIETADQLATYLIKAWSDPAFKSLELTLNMTVTRDIYEMVERAAAQNDVDFQLVGVYLVAHKR